MWTVLLAAWGGISVFVGPVFGYHPTSAAAWDWTKQNWLLHAVPGAVGVFAGLMMLGMIGARGMGRRSGISLAALLAMAAGAWFVIGPAAYRMLQSANAYAQSSTATDDFLHQVGANLGPGVLLLILGGMAFKAGTAVPRLVYEPVADGVATAPAERTATAAGRPVEDGTTRMATTGGGAGTREAGTTETAGASGTHFAGRGDGGAAQDAPVETGRPAEGA